MWLGRYGRRVIVLDTGQPRNAPTWAVHGFPGMPDVPPHELRRRLKEQCLARGVDFRDARVTELSGEKDGFLAVVDRGDPSGGRRVVLTFGRKDLLPPVPGIEELYGTSVFHCPDCDGPSVRDARVGVLGSDRHAAALALFLLYWARSVVLLADGSTDEPDDDVAGRLAAASIDLRRETITGFSARAGRLAEAHLEDAGTLPLDAIFFHPRTVPGCDLGGEVSPRCDAGGHLEVDRSQETSIPGVYAAGDLTGNPYLAISAAAEGVKAALAIHRSLLPERFSL